MIKYYQVFIVSLSEMFVWKLNFVLWRVRQIFELLWLYFLWATVFLSTDRLFGYDRAEILTYILGVSIIRSFVLSSRSVDVSGEILEGDLTNFLIRPVSYISWWWARDIADKVINILFATVEISVFIFIFRPPLFVQTNPITLSLVGIGVVLALILFFYFSFLVSLSAFWIREVWGIRFVTQIILLFLAGGFFPLDILPAQIFTLLQATPFPYLLFFPVKIYLGQLEITQIIFGFGVLFFWVITTFALVNLVWKRGMLVYSAERR